MQRKKVLVIEDDQDISELVRHTLTREGYDVSMVSDGGGAIDAALRVRPDLVLLDLMLPGVDGIDVCRQIRNEEALKTVPIIMLTAKGEEADVLVGLQMGADDYMAKPFSPKVLLARIKAILRRAVKEGCAADKDQREYGDLVIDVLKHRVAYKGKAVPLTAIEFDILEFLSRFPGRVYTREQILDNVWKDGKFIIDRAVDVHVRGLRKKLGNGETYIETVRSIGYCFREGS